MRFALLIPTLLVGAVVGPLSAVEAAGVAAVQEGVPGGTFVKTVKVLAKVVSVDPATRMVVVSTETGRDLRIKVPAESANFDQVQVGAMVRIQLVEELVVAMADGASATKDGAVAAVALAPEGAKPGGVIAQATRVTATVKAIDQEQRIATLAFPDGSTKQFKVRPDVDLKARAVGESVSFTVTEAIAISVEKP